MAGVVTAVPAEPLLTSKLAVPPPPGGTVDRPRLYSLLDAGTRGPVTLLVAPAGWGKTVLLSDWAPTVTGPVGWLTLEPADTGERFWWYLHAALTASGLTDPLPPPRPRSGAGYLTQLAEALAGQARPVVLVLDDLHQVRDPEVTEGLDFLLRHAGAGLRLVVASRSEPDLPLHRWRLRDELMELRTAELSFTPAETERAVRPAGHRPARPRPGPAPGPHRGLAGRAAAGRAVAARTPGPGPVRRTLRRGRPEGRRVPGR